MRRFVVAVAVVSVVFLFFASSGAVEASPDDHTAPLDRGFENVGEVTVNGTTYEVYRYDNLLPYASGYEFFSDGESVEDAEEAQRVARAYAWNLALNEEMEDEDVRTLRDVGRTADRAGDVISTPLAVIDTVLDRVDEAKEREVLGVSVWDVAVSALPELSGIESALRVTRDELRRWDERVGNIGEDVTDVAEAAESVRSGGEAEYGELPALFENASEGLREAEEISDALASDLSASAGTAGDIAEGLEETSRVGDRLAPAFSRLSSSLEEAAETVESFSESAAEGRGVVERTHDRAEKEESSLAKGWNKRRNAGALVYGTGLLVLLVVALSGYVYRRRSELSSSAE